MFITSDSLYDFDGENGKEAGDHLFILQYYVHSILRYKLISFTVIIDFVFKFKVEPSKSNRIKIHTTFVQNEWRDHNIKKNNERSLYL